jgi:hypothetical protein
MTSSQSRMFRVAEDHGEPHESNDDFDEPSFYFHLETVSDESSGRVTGYFSRDEFDWLAERLGVPKVAEVNHG